MRPTFKPDTHTEAALYWSAIGLIVCEGFSIEEAATHLGVEEEDLRMIMQRRSAQPPVDDSARSHSLKAVSHRELI
jgi:hypothetical protein